MQASKRFPNMKSVLLVVTLSSSYLNFVEGHGYMHTPRSRNFYASQSETSTNGSESGVPTTEYCRHCLNRKVANGSCGKFEQTDYDEWLDSQGNPMPWISQETYDEGDTITVAGELTTNHAGHIEVYACPNYGNTSPDCFLANPLTMRADTLHSGPIDNNYPVRGYLSPGSSFEFLYQLPTGLSGDKVIIQWRYITANSCHPPGYTDPDLELPPGWLRGPNLPACGELDPTGVGIPEQFWNCAEVTIVNANPTKSPAPTTSATPTMAPTSAAPTPTPMTSMPITPTAPTSNPPTPPPVSSPTSQSGYCSWTNCDGVDSSPWCSESEGRCLSCGSGTWCQANGPTPPPTNREMGYCSWSTPLCNGGDDQSWCSFSQQRCEEQCAGGTWCGADGPAPTSPTSPTSPTATPPTSGPVYATTTRYWDCSGGACGCAYLPFGPGTDDEPAMCYSNAMFDAPVNNPYGATFYGTAAISQGLGGGNWLAEGCGKCWKVTGTSNAPGYVGVETTLVLKGTNYCPPGNVMCAGSNPHFDISAPGFDVTEYSLANTCAVREAAESAGFAACGRWLIDSADPNENCDCSLFIDPVLRAGCENFFSLKWDNAPVLYEEVNCPIELSRLNCWEENGNRYPDDIPQFCANNDGVPNFPPTAPPAIPPVASTSPTAAPADIVDPTQTPSVTPSDEPICVDSTSNFSGGGGRFGCSVISSNINYCSYLIVQSHCPVTCDACQTYACEDSEMQFIAFDNRVTCGMLASLSNDLIASACEIEVIYSTCRNTCEICAPLTSAPSTALSKSPTNPPTDLPTGRPTTSPSSKPSSSPVSSQDVCCSQYFNVCKDNDFCQLSEENCTTCNGVFLPGLPLMCIARYGECTDDEDGCCFPSTCISGTRGTYKQCMYYP